MEDLPEGLFRNAIDLNRFSNGTSKKLINSYNRIILRAVAELKRIEAMPSAQRPKVRAARLRALLAQTRESLRTWSVKSVDELARDLEGIAQIQSDFATQQISRALSPSARQLLSVNSVEVTPSFARAVVNADPLSVSTNILSRSMEEVVKGPSPSFKLTATQGSQIRMPGGTSIAKTFRGLAERNAERFATVVQDGLLTGETTQQLARQLVGNLDFGDIGPLSVKQLAQSGGELTKLANHQVMTLTRTSVNQVANTASQQVYKANPDLTEKYKYVATLDSKTSPICRELDGKEFIYGKGPEPAQHFNCRSTTVAVIDYGKIQEKYPNVKPPSKPLGKRAAAGGSVPSDTTYGKWLHGQRAKTKSGKISKFEPGPMQIKTLGKEKAKYFNRLADKYGADEAMKKFLRDDGSEVSLATLHKRYGDPSKIVKAKPKPKVKPKPKPTTIKQLDKEITKTKTELKTAKAKLKALEERDPTLPTIAQLQGIPEGSKIKATDVNQAFDLMDGMDGAAGANARKLRKFAEKRQVFASWSNGREATGPWSKQKEKMAYLMDNPQFKKSLQLNKKRGEKGIVDSIAPDFDPITNKFIQKNSVRARRGIHYSENGLDDVNRGMNSAYLDKFFTMKGNKGAGGYTFQGANHIVLRRETTFKPIKNLKEVRDAVKASVQNAVKGEPSQLVERLLYKRVYSKDITKPSRWVSQQSWLTTYVHEMGHQIHYAANRPAMTGNQWIPSIYGKSNYMEQFAESFVQYVFDPVGLKKASPGAYKWVDDAMAAALKAPI